MKTELNTTTYSDVASSAVLVPANIITQPTLDELTVLYKSQERECWLCDTISHKILDKREISDDDQWHFTSCVLSWEHVHRH